MIVQNHYYVAVRDGTVSVMRGYEGSLLNYPLQRQSRVGCLSNQNELSIFDVGQQPNGCRQLKVDDLNQTGRTQIAGLPGGSLDEATEQMRNLVKQSALPVCPSSTPTSTPPTTTTPKVPPSTTPVPPTDTTGPSTAQPSPSLTAPPTTTPTTAATLAPKPQEPGTDCRPAA
jgi:protein phosphatase